MNKLFSVLEQCYCMKDAPNDDYPVNKGICQYCQIKALMADTMRENERLKAIMRDKLPKYLWPDKADRDAAMAEFEQNPNKEHQNG